MVVKYKYTTVSGIESACKESQTSLWSKYTKNTADHVRFTAKVYDWGNLYLVISAAIFDPELWVFNSIWAWKRKNYSYTELHNIEYDYGIFHTLYFSQWAFLESSAIQFTLQKL